MVNQYLVEIDLPRVLTPDFANLIPAQRATVNRLLQNGDIKSYALALDRSKLWVVMVGKTQDQVTELLESFPIIDFCETSINELLFHDMASHELPRMSMN